MNSEGRANILELVDLGFCFSPFKLVGHSDTCPILIERTLGPRQRVLKGIEEIPHDPGDQGVVVESDQEGHQHGGYACEMQFDILSSPMGIFMFDPSANSLTNTGEVGADGSPHSYAALPEALANGKLQQQ